VGIDTNYFKGGLTEYKKKDKRKNPLEEMRGRGSNRLVRFYERTNS